MRTATWCEEPCPTGHPRDEISFFQRLAMMEESHGYAAECECCTSLMILPGTRLLPSTLCLPTHTHAVHAHGTRGPCSPCFWSPSRWSAAAHSLFETGRLLLGQVQTAQPREWTSGQVHIAEQATGSGKPARTRTTRVESLGQQGKTAAQPKGLAPTGPPQQHTPCACPFR